MNKILFLERLFRERDKFELLLNHVGFARQMTIKGVVENLSVKDLLADVFSHEQFIADRLNEILHNEIYSPSDSYAKAQEFQAKYGFPDYESEQIENNKINQFVVEKYKNIALDEIVAQELAAFSNIISAIEQITHNQFLDHNLFHRIAEHTYKPYRQISLLINRWLKKIATESK